eukprot:352586-Chlamydomonas_euryale.AAC.3
MDSTKHVVFPDPLCACAMRSLYGGDKIIGSVMLCTLDGRSNCRRDMRAGGRCGRASVSGGVLVRWRQDHRQRDALHLGWPLKVSTRRVFTNIAKMEIMLAQPMTLPTLKRSGKELLVTYSVE